MAGIQFQTTPEHATGDLRFADDMEWLDHWDAAAQLRQEQEEEEQRRMEEEREAEARRIDAERRAREWAAEVRRQEEEERIREEGKRIREEQARIREGEAQRLREAEWARVHAGRQEEQRLLELGERQLLARLDAQRAREAAERAASLAAFEQQVNEEMADEAARDPSPINIDDSDDEVPGQTGMNLGETEPVDPNLTFGTMFGLDWRRVGEVPLLEPEKVSGT